MAVKGNCDVAPLNFGMDRILSDQNTPENCDKVKRYSFESSLSYPSIYPPYYAGYNYYQYCINLSYPPELREMPKTVMPDNFGNPSSNCVSVIRPLPVRPASKELPLHSRPVENTNFRRRSWTRAVFSSLQRKGLEKRFAMQKYITKPDRRALAATLGLTDAQVKVWFQNRRMKFRHSMDADKNGESSSASYTAGASSNSPPTGDENNYDDEEIDIESN